MEIRNQQEQSCWWSSRSWLKQIHCFVINCNSQTLKIQGYGLSSTKGNVFGNAIYDSIYYFISVLCFTLTSGYTWYRAYFSYFIHRICMRHLSLMKRLLCLKSWGCAMNALVDNAECSNLPMTPKVVGPWSLVRNIYYSPGAACVSVLENWHTLLLVISID